jgi:SAM-dependent methyltransferase
VIQPDRVLRLLNERGASVLDAFLKSDTVQTFRASIVETRPAGTLAVEHPKVWFPSYPYEWPAEMLYAAGELTLDLATRGLEEGWGLKDATPYNILFEGPRPIFVDVCSFEQRDPGDSIWLAYGQFVRTFLNPLIAHRHLRFPIDALLLTRRDGVESEQLYRWTPLLSRWFNALLLTRVTLPALLGRRRAGGHRSAAASPKLKDGDEASWVLKRVMRSLRRALEAVGPGAQSESRWTGYMQTFTYSPEQFEFKSKFVEEALNVIRPRRTLDVGCNTGYFSKMAAASGSRVIAIDRDPAVVGRLWTEARNVKLDIQPLVADFARPTPATGWRNGECASFLDRAESAFDLVLLLGMLHHLTVTDRVPVVEVLDQAARVASHTIIEYVGPEDEMFRLLARGNEHLYLDYTVEAFESACRSRFEIIRVAETAGSHRRLYLLSNRP